MFVKCDTASVSVECNTVSVSDRCNAAFVPVRCNTASVFVDIASEADDDSWMGIEELRLALVGIAWKTSANIVLKAH